MNFQYLKLPLSIDKLISKQKHPTCAIKQSVAQNIHLILLTRYEEYHYDPTYGCGVWEDDFTLKPTLSAWSEKIRKSIVETITEHEHRIADLSVEVEIVEEEFIHSRDEKLRQIKKRIRVEATGKIKETDEDFTFKEDIFMSPLSLD